MFRSRRVRSTARSPLCEQFVRWFIDLYQLTRTTVSLAEAWEQSSAYCLRPTGGWLESCTRASSVRSLCSGRRIR